MKLLALLLAILLLAGCDDDGGADRPSPRPSSPTWQIGPIIDGTNYSKGLPTSTSGSFAISPTAEPHYVTRSTGSLAGKTEIRLRFKVEGEGTIHGAGCPETSASMVSIYIQRKGDDWQRNGWRWWHKPSRRKLAGAGEWEIAAPLAPIGWGSILGMTAEGSPVNWNATLRDTGRVGFTFANCKGAGHGAAATGPMRFTVLAFEVR